MDCGTTKQKTVYTTFTNNKVRETTDAANPRAKNRYGQILKWEATNGDHASSKFKWTMFALAGNPAVKEGLQVVIKLSKSIIYIFSC